MDRRTLLKLLAATALSGCVSNKHSGKQLSIVVAGAGIVGSSIAYHLAKTGVAVTVVDKQGPATHASRGTFAWMNATWAKQPQSYHRLNQTSVSNWHELQRELSLPVRWGGSLEWFDGDVRQLKLEAQLAEQRLWGEPARMIGAREFSRLEPNIQFNADSLAGYSPNDGTLDPVVTTHKLLAAAQRMGATLSYPNGVEDVEMNNGQLQRVVTSQGSIKADRLVLATGAEPKLCADLALSEVPQRSTPGIIVITKPAPRLINRVVVAPGIHMHQRDDGRVVLGEQDGAPANARHAARLTERPNQFPSSALAQQHATRMLGVAAQYVPRLATATAEHVYIGWRPLPVDGHPVIGASPTRPDVYIAVMHSGVSLAPVVGQLVTAELVDGRQIAQLEEFRPGRKFAAVKRY